MAKADLIQQAKDLDLEVDETMTTKQIQALIDSASEEEENNPEGDQDEDANKKYKKGDVYMVAKGKEFRDKDNFSKVWKSGHDVSHFAPERLDHLVNTGMVIKK